MFAKICASISILAAAQAANAVSIQPLKDEVLGNVLEVGEGSRNILSANLTPEQVRGGLYAIDGQTPNTLDWTRNESNYRPLYFGTNNSPADGSATWKIKATAGHTFLAGEVVMRGTTVWAGAQFGLYSHSHYAPGNGTGVAGYIQGTGTLYGSDIHAPGAPWEWSEWKVPVPKLATEFFVTGAMRQDWGHAWAQDLNVRNVMTTSLPPIANGVDGGSLPAGWVFWAEQPEHAQGVFRSVPGEMLAVRMGNARQWSLRPNREFQVAQGEPWTFTAVVAGRNLGSLSNAGGCLRLFGVDAQGQVVTWDISNTSTWKQGTFPWTTLKVTVPSMPPGIVKILPEFYGHGGGEFFVAYATAGKGSSAQSLPVPAFSLPPIQPDQENVYGNGSVVPDGNTTVFSPSSTDASFLERTFAINGESRNLLTWTKDEPNSRPLYLGSNNTPADGSVTWKIQAPEGRIFLGGEVELQGTTIWGGATMGLYAHSRYGSGSGTGKGGYVSGTGVLYHSDIRAPTAPWNWTVWKVAVPKQSSEFYLTGAMRQDWSQAWGQRLVVSNVLTSSLPPMFDPSTPDQLGSGWRGWPYHKDPLKVVPASGGQPAFLSYAIGSADLHNIHIGKTFSVTKDEYWTFTAVMKRRNLGWMGTGGDHGVQLLAVDHLGRNYWGSKLAGTSGWEVYKATFKIENTSPALSLELKITGGGELFLASATFERSQAEASLPGPVASFIPPAGTISAEPDITGGKPDHIYAPGETISWTLHAAADMSSRTFAYKVVDQDGREFPGSGRFNTPILHANAETGYYRLVVIDPIVMQDGTAYAIKPLRAMVVPSPVNWAYGRTAFGIPQLNPGLMARLGFTWSRPLEYNINYAGNHPLRKTLPEPNESYSTTWKNYLSDPAKKAIVDGPWAKTIEIWNEPRNDLYGVSGGNVTQRNWGDLATRTDFANMLFTARDGIKFKDPNIRISLGTDGGNDPGSDGNLVRACYDLNGNPMSIPEHTPCPGKNEPPSLVFFRDLQKVGARPYFEIAVLHPYTAVDNAAQTSVSPEKFDMGNLGLIEYINLAKSYINPPGQPGTKDIHVTEFGWPTDPVTKASVSESQQAEYMVRGSLLMVSQGITKLHPFLLDDLPDHDLYSSMGLRTIGGAPKPSLLAYTTLAQTIDNLPYQGRFATTHPADGNSALLLFGDQSRSVLVAWNPTKSLALNKSTLGQSGLGGYAVKSIYGKVLDANAVLSVDGAPKFITFSCPWSSVSNVTTPFLTGGHTFIPKSDSRNSENYFSF